MGIDCCNSLCILFVLAIYYDRCAPKILIKWDAPDVEVQGSTKVKEVTLVDSKLIIVLSNGKVIEEYIPTQIVVRDKTIKCLIGELITLFAGLIIFSFIGDELDIREQLQLEIIRTIIEKMKQIEKTENPQRDRKK